MSKMCRCGHCGKRFDSLKEKTAHKKANPDGSCVQEDVEGRSIMEKENKEDTQEKEIEEPKEALKEIPKIKMPKEQAKEAWKKYCEVLKKRKESFLKTMKQAHYQMKEGRELIDVYKVMKGAGLNENNEPKLALARADLKEVVFEKKDEGSGTFDMSSNYGWRDNVALPQNTFKVHWERQEGQPDTTWWIKDKRIKTKVPIVPIELLPEGDLSNYYILWEANEWEELPETKDPLLLKRISENLFAILGSWDLTELEQSIISGGK